MEAYLCVTELMERNAAYEVEDMQYYHPVQQQQSTNLLPTPDNISPAVQLFQSQRINPPGNVSSFVGVIPESQASSVQNPRPETGVYMADNNYYMQQSCTNIRSDACSNLGSVTNDYMAQVLAVEIPSQPRTEQLNDDSNGMNDIRNDFQQNHQKPKSPEFHMKRMMNIPEPTKVKTRVDVREKIGGLKIEVSGSFLSWNVTGRTILDLNFMRNLFYLTKIDIIFQPNFPYETGVCEGLKKLVQNNLFSDWLVLKCEEKQMPFFKVTDQVEIYSVNNFTTLLSIIAQESCLPLPFITKHEKAMNYFYLNFPKVVNDRVKKLNQPIFHDADNGRKKISCKYPGIRLDCTFESAIQRFVIHVQKSAVPAFREYVSYLRQAIIYNHIVWGFLQAWTRRVREQYNGCFKTQEIAENLSLCRGDEPQNGKTISDENDLIYYIDYSNFYLKFDPVALRDTTVSFTVENFETNFVSDVSIVQYYRQFFLINDMHYSDALKNIILFSDENGARNVTEFVYMPPKDNANRSNTRFFLPGGISRSSSHHQLPQMGKTPLQSNLPAGRDMQKTKQTPAFANPHTADGLDKTPPGNSEAVPQRAPSNRSAPLSKPLIKTRTVEEINSSVEMKKCLNGSQVSFDSILAERGEGNGRNSPPVPSCLRETLNHCFLVNRMEICRENVTRDPKVLQKIFNEALSKAMEMRSIEGFIEKLYVTLQKSFTNSTCQLIMNRTIRKALEVRFPNLKPRLSGQNPVRNEPRWGATAVTGAPYTAKVPEFGNVQTPQPKPTERVDGVQNKTNTSEGKVVSPPGKTNIKPKPQQTPEPALQVINVVTPPPGGPGGPPHPAEQAPERELVIVEDPPQPPSSSLQSPPKPNLKRSFALKTNNVVPNKKSEESSCIVNNENNRNREAKDLGKSPKKVRENFERGQKRTNDPETVTEASMIVVETENNISINLTLPISTNVETSFVSETTPEKPDVGKETSKSSGQGVRDERHDVSLEERVEAMRTEETSSASAADSAAAEQDLFARYNIKPCSVVLNANDVANHLKIQNGRKRLRERQREGMFTNAVLFGYGDDDDSNIRSGDDSSDSDFVPSATRKKRRKISELQYMEARTRVLQRLRKRNHMYVLSNSGQTVYTSDELDEFLVENPQGSQNPVRSPRVENSEKEHSLAEGAKYRALCNECLTRKVKVVLVRLQDMPEYQKQRDKWRVVTKADGRLTLTRDYSEEYENLPRSKRKYFEFKDGKLYLKEQYHVKNGRILPVNQEIQQDSVNLKGEPPSLQDESNCLPSFIKQEIYIE